MPVDFEKMKQLRLDQDLTLAEVARRAKLANRQQLHQIERGLRPNLTINTLDRIAAALGVTVKDLLK